MGAALLVGAGGAGPSQVADGRWEETGYGVSIEPPAGAQLNEHPSDDVLVHMTLPSGATASLAIRDSAIDLTIEKLVVEAIHQLASTHPSAVILDQNQTEFAGRPGAMIFFTVPSGRQGPWVLGQAYTQLGPQTFVVLRLEAAKPVYKRARPVFETIADSLAVRDRGEILRMRSERIVRGESWIKSVTTEQLHAALEPERWLRILAGGKDVGYMRVTQERTEQLGRPGIGVRIQSRIKGGVSTTDSLSEFFLSDDGNHEIWSIRTTARDQRNEVSRRGDRPTRPNSTAVETGLRAYDRITVNRQTPIGAKHYEWSTPPHGYLSQVRLILGGSMLARSGWDAQGKTELEMGFYAYDPSKASLSYRNVRAARLEDGSMRIDTRPSPAQGEQTAHFDAGGDLVRKDLPGGQTLQPANKQHIAALWNLR